MMAPRVVETHTLDVIDRLSKDKDTNDKTLCNVFGILLMEEDSNNTTYWYLCDEFCYKGLKIKLCGSLESYPKARHGDIVRVHRLGFDKNIKIPVVFAPRNVVVWPAFAYDPTPLTSALSTTILDEDIERRRALETYYCSRMMKVSEIKQTHIRASTTSSRPPFLDVAGRVEHVMIGNFNEYLVSISDGTGKIIVRVFSKSPDVPFESDVHFKIAAELKPGDYIAALSTKLVRGGEKLDLSANTSFGRALRIVDKSSILGVILDQSLGSDQQQSPASEISSQESRIQELRRSPRLNKQISQNISSTSQDQQSSQNSQSSGHIQMLRFPHQEPLPKFTKLCDIERKPTSNSFDFHDIVGQVRGKPIQSESYYDNWLFQIYDGSKLEFACYKSELVPGYTSDCAVVIVFRPQYPNDSNKHVEVVEKLNDGDLVFIKNIKAVWRSDRLSLEMNANVGHGKSIEVIERHSQFGIHLLDIVTNPIDDVDEQFYSPVNSDDDMDVES